MADGGIKDSDLRAAHWRSMYDLINAQYARTYENLARAIHNAFLLNGGAAVALLTLVGALRKNDAAIIGLDRKALFSVIIFGVGLFFGVLANWYLYKNTQAYADDLTTRTPIDEFPFSKYSQKWQEIQQRHNAQLRKTFICFRMSVVSFVAALVLLAWALWIALLTQPQPGRSSAYDCARATD